MQVELLQSPAVCWWPLLLGPWGTKSPKFGCCYVVIWWRLYITVWTGGRR